MTWWRSAEEDAVLGAEEDAVLGADEDAVLGAEEDAVLGADEDALPVGGGGPPLLPPLPSHGRPSRSASRSAVGVAGHVTSLPKAPPEVHSTIVASRAASQPAAAKVDWAPTTAPLPLAAASATLTGAAAPVRALAPWWLRRRCASALEARRMISLKSARPLARQSHSIAALW